MKLSKTFTRVIWMLIGIYRHPPLHLCTTTTSHPTPTSLLPAIVAATDADEPHYSSSTNKPCHPHHPAFTFASKQTLLFSLSLSHILVLLRLLVLVARDQNFPVPTIRRVAILSQPVPISCR